MRCDRERAAMSAFLDHRQAHDGQRCARLCFRSGRGLWVVELAHRQKPLSFFVLENVEGVLKRAKQDSMPFAHWFSSEMMRMLPQGWDIKIQRHNSKHCGVAQSRPRVFIVGTGPAMHRTLFQRMVLGAPLTSFPPVSLMHFLELEADDQDFDNLTLHQQLNVMSQMERFHSECGSSPVGCVDCGRDIFKGYDNTIAHDSTHTLRTSNKNLWLLPAPSTQHIFGTHGRLLRVSEKARLSGIVPSSLRGLPVADAERALGNTIPVPLIGLVLLPLPRVWAEAVRQDLRSTGLAADLDNPGAFPD